MTKNSNKYFRKAWKQISGSKAVLPSNSCLLTSFHGFTLIELVMVIVLLGIMAVTVAVRWPSGLKEEGANLEFIRAIRYAQHKALTREYTTAGAAWGLIVVANQYTIRRADSSDLAEAEYVNRSLLNDTSVTLGPATGVYFNGLGEPIDSGGVPLGSTTFTINGSSFVTICPETGFATEGVACP